MQDWIHDDHDAFSKALKTSTQLRAEEFMTCESCEQQPWFSFFFDGIGVATIKLARNHYG